MYCADVGIGRQEGLKIPCPKGVRVRFPLCAPNRNKSRNRRPVGRLFLWYG